MLFSIMGGKKRIGEKLGQELKNWRKKKIPKSSHKIHYTGQKLIFILKLAINRSLISLTSMVLYYIVILSFPSGSLLSSKNTKGHI